MKSTILLSLFFVFSAHAMVTKLGHQLRRTSSVAPLVRFIELENRINDKRTILRNLQEKDDVHAQEGSKAVGWTWIYGGIGLGVTPSLAMGGSKGLAVVFGTSLALHAFHSLILAREASQRRASIRQESTDLETEIKILQHERGALMDSLSPQ